MKLGEEIPTFSLENQDGETVHIKNHIGKYPIIIFFYPKNFTRGCTKEVCGFRDNYEKISETGAVIFGISSDSIESHKKFKQHYNLPFDLLSDNEGKVKKLFGVKNEIFGIIPRRATFLFDNAGKLRMEYNSLFGVVDHVKNTIAALESM